MGSQRPVARWTGAIVGVAVVGVLAVGCGSGGDAPDVASTSTAPTDPASATAPTTTTAGSSTTIAAGVRLCDLLAQPDLDAVAAGLTLSAGTDAALHTTIGSTGAEAACEWFVSTDDVTFDLALVVATDVTSTDYEEILANPQLGDPFTVPDLGEMASAGGLAAGRSSSAATAYVLVYERQRLVQLTSDDADVLGREQLVALARAVLPRL